MLRHAAAALTLLALCVGTSTAVPLGIAREKTATDEAIDKGLEFLKQSQDTDGSWGNGINGRGGKSTAVTSLAVMAFLSAGHVPGEGKYGKTIEDGVRWVLARQRPNGLMSAPGDAGPEMYHHGIATLMMAEVAGMTDDKLGKDVRKRLEKAIELILSSQMRKDGPHKGGWRYTIDCADADMSVTGWQLMALRAAKNLGCDIPAESIDKAVEYVKRSVDPGTGGFRYMAAGGGVTIPCTGTGILVLELSGKNMHRSKETLRAGSFILQAHPGDYDRMGHYFYGIYYCSQAMFQLGGNYWAEYRQRLHDQLLRNQNARNGSWLGAEGHQYGTAYCTSMAILSLTVEYRFLPIYQRDESADEPSK
jgi:prenyltransferase beta subunit